MSNNFNLDTFRLNQELVAVHMDASTMEEAITILADILIEHAYIKPSYTAAAIEREAAHPTGLPTPGVGTAIPHADVEHTLKPGIAVGTVKTPVKFGQLGDPDNQIDISVIFMLSVTEPTTQVYLLQSLVEVYKEESLLLKIQAATDPDVIVREVNAAFTKVQALKDEAS